MAFRTKTRNPDVRKGISALKMAFSNLEGWELVQSGPRSFEWLRRDGVLRIRLNAVLQDAEPSSCWASVGECDRVTPFVVVKWEEGSWTASTSTPPAGDTGCRKETKISSGRFSSKYAKN